MGMVSEAEIGFHEFRIRAVEAHGQFFFRIHSHEARYFRITLFVSPESVGGMEVQRNSEIPSFQEGKEGLRIGEILSVPGIARPTAPVFPRNLSEVPVDVDDEDGKRDSAFSEVFQQFLHLFFGIVPEFAPPVAERVSRNEGNAAADFIKILQAGLVIVPVTEEVEIEIAGNSFLKPALIPKNISLGIVDDCEILDISPSSSFSSPPRRPRFYTFL